MKKAIDHTTRFIKGASRHWIHGLVAAFIGGGASAVSAGFSAMVIDPSKFNLSAGLRDTCYMMGACFIINGVLSAMAYLKQSPIPPEET